MIGQDMVNQLYDRQVVDSRGEKIGAVKQVWIDGRTGDPLWASVHTGLFGLKESFVPLQRAEIRGDDLQVPVVKEQVKESPRIEVSDDHMTDEEQATLYQYYGLGPQAGGAHDRQPSQRQAAGRQPGTRQGADHGRGTQTGLGGEKQPGPGRPQHGAGESMTRSEEELRVGTERVESGKVRLVKHVVTEQQQIQVPVSHEEVRIEREPLTGKDRAAAERGTGIGEEQQEMTLHAEKPVVHKETVAKERVRMSKEKVTDTETVSGTVRKEQIDIEDGREKRR
jgi:uncharacterized protein (TIGR02271 family)